MKYIDWSIIRRSVTGTLNEKEEAILQKWIGDSPGHKALYEEVCHFYNGGAEVNLVDEKFLQHKKEFESKLAAKKPVGRFQRWYWRAAAILLPLFVGGAYFFLTHPGQEHIVAEVIPIQPGIVKAFVYNMNTGAQTVITMNGEETVFKDIVSKAVDTVADKQEVLDRTFPEGETLKIVIPRGAEYPLTLPDGSVVQLNSFSELTYSTNLDLPERRVHLKGEGYFNVKADPGKPFIVVADEVEVKVYGTRFNVNTHSSKFIQTVVEQGAVSVKANGSPEKMLKPDEMGQYDRSTGKIEIHQVNINLHLSWKSGYYMFENKPTEEIMEELALWFDVKVVYLNEEARRQRFSGSLPRHRELADLLEPIERTTRVTFEVKERTIYVR